jgi:uncharacterized protein YraI
MNFKLTLAAGLTAVALFATAGTALAATGVATGGVNVREGAGTDYDVIGTLAKGEIVEIVDCGGGWCEINDDGDEGYVSAAYLALLGDDDEDDDDDDDHGHHHHDDYYDDVDVEFEFDHGGVELEFEF